MTFFRRLTALVDRLTHELDDAQKSRNEERAAHHISTTALRAQLREREEELLRLNLHAAEVQQRVRRLAGEQVQTLKALRALADAVKPRNSPHITPEDAEGIVRAHREAVELLKLLEVPFA